MSGDDASCDIQGNDRANTVRIDAKKSLMLFLLVNSDHGFRITQSESLVYETCLLHPTNTRIHRCGRSRPIFVVSAETYFPSWAIILSKRLNIVVDVPGKFTTAPNSGLSPWPKVLLVIRARDTSKRQ